jgi:hypothetical protein
MEENMYPYSSFGGPMMVGGGTRYGRYSGGYGRYGAAPPTPTVEELQQKVTTSQYIALSVIGLYALTFFIALPLMARRQKRLAGRAA